MDIKINKNFLLKEITSTRVGGPARYFVVIKNEDELTQAMGWVRARKIKWTLIGDGTNLIPADGGFDGLVIKNQIKKFAISSPESMFGSRTSKHVSSRGYGIVTIGAGNNLLQTIRQLNKLGLGGMEKMTGIPGTVGGAIYGCAGAYGQEIKDCLLRVRVSNVWKFDFQTLGRGRCRFGYRDSIFKKHRDWIITEAVFRLKKSDPVLLQKTSAEIIKTREQKYWPGLACPGSFFKNIVMNSLGYTARKKLLSRIDQSKITHGKLPAGYLLEQVGAKGMKIKGISVADHHANLIYNTGRGQARDIKKISRLLKNKVRQKFGVILEEEIQYLTN